MKNTTTDLAGKNQVYLVTGGTSGVGQAIATGLAAKGAKVVILSRTAESGRQGVAHIAAATGNDRAEFLVADLSLLASIRSASDEFKRRFDNLHVLVHAAGALYFDQQFTAEGNEMTLAVNYLGPWPSASRSTDRVAVIRGGATRTPCCWPSAPGA